MRSRAGAKPMLDGGDCARDALDAAVHWPALRVLDDKCSYVRVVRTAAELERIGRLRYQRFVVDQGQPYAASGGVEMLIDPIDRRSLNLYVEDAKAISMAVRLSWCSDVAPDDYLALLRQSLPPDIACGRTIICSRLIASSAGRSDLANLVVLFRRAFEIGTLSGCHYSVLSTLPHRIPLFERFGYRRMGICLDDRIAGAQEVLLLDLRDSAHMEAVNSPFLVVTRQLALAAKPIASRPFE